MRKRTSRVRPPQLAALVAPVAVPVSMWWLFGALGRRLPPTRAYNLGFAIYWIAWCTAFPIAVLGSRRARHALSQGRTPTTCEWALLAIPVAGALTTTLLPQRRNVDTSTAAVMVSTAAVNAVGEELLWRGVFIELFPQDPVRGALWPMLGFTAWHLAPQRVLPSAKGRWAFTLGAGVVGAVSTMVAYRSGGLRHVLLPHIATDACGVDAARFRLARSAPH
jgi:membrane protease YdiL (CAAX protease family)